MLAFDAKKIIDQFNKHENELLDRWNMLPSIYDGNNYLESKKYENIAGAINHIEKVKHMILYDC